MRSLPHRPPSAARSIGPRAALNTRLQKSLSDKLKNKSLLFFLFSGLLSGVLCWFGGRFLPEGSLLPKIYPGLVLGMVLCFVGVVSGRVPDRWRAARLLVVVASTVAGWRLSVDVGYQYGQPIPFITAGALGALTVALGLLWPWSIRFRMAGFVLLVTASGAFGGMIFKAIGDLFPNMHEDVWVLVLFAEWQAIFMLGTCLAAGRSNHRARS
jgi:hypothetical protein